MREGFTLTEMLIVVIIIGVLAAGIAPQIKQYLDSTKATALTEAINTAIVGTQSFLTTDSSYGKVTNGQYLVTKGKLNARVEGTVIAVDSSWGVHMNVYGSDSSGKAATAGAGTAGAGTGTAPYAGFFTIEVGDKVAGGAGSMPADVLDACVKTVKIFQQKAIKLVSGKKVTGVATGTPYPQVFFGAPGKTSVFAKATDTPESVCKKLYDAGAAPSLITAVFR